MKRVCPFIHEECKKVIPVENFDVDSYCNLFYQKDIPDDYDFFCRFHNIFWTNVDSEDDKTNKTDS